MIPNDPEKREEMIDRMLKVCVENSEELTTWENNFVESVDAQFQTRRTLTDRQCEILEKIYDAIE